jgi:diadenosine tetraphosphate (Ap4A) HIT family hydrolase
MKSDEYLVTETKFWRVIQADDQLYLGRCYINLKRHAKSLSDLTKEEWLDFLELIKKLEKAIKKAFGADLFNWTCMMNHAYRNNPPTPHVHWHLRPRYKNPVKILDVLFEDKEFGSRYSHDKGPELTEKVRKEILKKIQSSL